MDKTLLITVAIAAGLGLFGQALRAMIGLKKHADEAAAKGERALAGFDFARFAISLVLGALAGVAAWLGLRFGISPAAADLHQGTVLFAVVAAGYSGADFVEAFLKRQGVA